MTKTITPFSFLTAGQIRFGRGAAAGVAEDVARLGNRVLLVRGRSVPWVDELRERLVALRCSVVTAYGQGEPTIKDVEEAVRIARGADVDVVVAVGGGSVIDLGKATAAMNPAKGQLMSYLEGVGGGLPLDADPLPFIAVPTTAGTGSEVTKNAVIGVPDTGRKISLRDVRMLPRLAIVDPTLTDGTPLVISLTSGLDAVTQVIEPYLSIRSNPLTDALCRAAIPMGLNALAQLAEKEDSQARDQISYVSLVGGISLANAGLGAVHGLAGVIGGRFGAPHGLVCGRLLGPVLDRNRLAELTGGTRTDRYSEIAIWMANAFDLAADTAFEELPAWLDKHKLPRLGNLIKSSDDIVAIAIEAAATSSMKTNPTTLRRADLIRAVTEVL